MEVKAFAEPQEEQKAWEKTINLFFFRGHSPRLVSLAEPQR